VISSRIEWVMRAATLDAFNIAHAIRDVKR